MVSELAQKACVPCRGGVPPLGPEKVEALLQELGDWMVEQEYHLTKTFKFRDFG